MPRSHSVRSPGVSQAHTQPGRQPIAAHWQRPPGLTCARRCAHPRTGRAGAQAGGAGRTPRARPTGTEAEPAPSGRAAVRTGHARAAGRGLWAREPPGKSSAECGGERRLPRGPSVEAPTGRCDGRGWDDWRDLRKQNTVCTKLHLVRGGNPRGSKRVL